MCSEHKFRKGYMSPTTMNLVKITVVLVFFCFAECAAGSCLNYGHACWGAHGKRSGNQNSAAGRDEASGKDFNTKWFLSRLIQNPVDLRYTHERDLNIPSRHNSESLFAGNEIDNSLNGFNPEYDNLQDIFTDDHLSDDSLKRIMDTNRIKSSTFLEKRSVKHN